MTLEELADEIKGIIRIKDSYPISRCEISLQDNIGQEVRIRLSGHEEVLAHAMGQDIVSARQNLVNMLRGKIIKYDWPVTWDSYTGILHVPESLMP
jgi:hypothetical protein